MVVRFPGLGVPLFGDEATTFWEHASSSWQTLFSRYAGPNQHSLFSFFSNIAMQIFGESEISFRLPSCIAGVLIIPLTWLAGRQLLLTPQASLLAAFLVSFSWPLFEQSQQGRGYTLTGAFALIVFISGKKMISETLDLKVLLIFILSGISMVLILPSNIYFLAACSAFLIANFWLENANDRQLKTLILKAGPVLMMGMLASCYLLFIFDDLQRGLETYRIYARDMEGLSSLDPTINRSWEAFLYLSQPWGIPFCLLFIFGFLYVRHPALLLIFILPFLFNLVSGVQGPSRSYFYWIPFYLLVVSHGLYHLYEKLEPLLSKGVNRSIFLLVVALLILPPANSLEKFFGHRFEVQFVKMEEARTGLEYMESFPGNHLFVIPWEDRVLRYYAEKKVAENMLSIVQEGSLGKIIYASHKSLSPEKISSFGLVPENSFLPEYFKLIAQKGNLNFYVLDFQIAPFIPLEKDLNILKRFGQKNVSGLEISKDTQNKFVGKESLRIENRGSSTNLTSKLLRSVTLPPGTAFLLYIYAKEFYQASKAGVMGSRKLKGKPSDSLNLLFGKFKEDQEGLVWVPEHPYRNFRPIENKDGFYWTIVMLTNPIGVGLNHFQEAIRVQKETSHFDGMQAYILHSANIKQRTTQ